MSSPNVPIGPQSITKDEIDKKLAAFDSVPLFMKSLPTEDTEDVTLAALQSLAHEGTPDEVAENFKEQGNEYFKGNRYREALGFYTQGIDAHPTDVVLQEALLCNRAACNLELKNFGSVLRDCSKALILNQHSSKAYYRSALALLLLERVDEALDCCNRCLDFDAENRGVLGVRDRATKAKAEKDRREREKAERSRKEKEEKHQMVIAFKERNLIAIQKEDGSSNPYSPHFDAEDPTQSTLVLPVFFLYPQYATSDVIQEFVEDTPFAAHISAMFPPQAPPADWDTKREYIDGNLVIYAMTHRKRLLKVGKKMTLRDVCKAAKGKENEPKDGLEVKDGCLTFVVLPKGDVETKWVEEYKKTRDAT
ncbi:Tetratricopeptide repeat protein 4 [Hypsizygus marmoreus]|uniref:Tetratricopeptide repeat protein 4 n=1 Tax=Hypsizygus marmoreus TaxID=39966 RepID=A0A369JEB5_HYPMA|nr:Tetratricopeptide repeat protein 4 [Hypsizygus marmoreus]